MSNQDTLRDFLGSADQVIQLVDDFQRALRKALTGETVVPSSRDPVRQVQLRGGTLSRETWDCFIRPHFTSLYDALVDMLDDIKNPPDNGEAIANTLRHAARLVRTIQAEEEPSRFCANNYRQILDELQNFAKTRTEIDAIRSNFGMDDPFAALDESLGDHDLLEKFEQKMPPLDAQSGEWLTPREVLKHEPSLTSVESLKSMRAQGIKNQLQTFGVDKSGRFWRKKNEQVHYHKPSITPEGRREGAELLERIRKQQSV